MLSVIQLGLNSIRNKPADMSLADEPSRDQFASTAVLSSQIPLDAEVPTHTATTVQQRYRAYEIGASSMVTNVTEMTSSTPGSSGEGNFYLCSVTLSGPESPPQSFSFFNPSTWASPATKQVTLQMQIPSPECPDWEQANRNLMAIQLGLLMEDGYVTPAFSFTLQKHLGAEAN